jgi:hypothetical protein
MNAGTRMTIVRRDSTIRTPRQRAEVVVDVLDDVARKDGVDLRVRQFRIGGR